MLSWGRVQGGLASAKFLAERKPPPQGGGATNKSQPPRTKSNLKKKSGKKKNALTQDRTGRFTAILDFVMNG